jgi:RimJ/RimL family protein N-acetyltransferase
MLRVLSIEDMEPIRQWRNQCLSTLRTPFPLTTEQQEDWYRNEICNRQSRSRFWAIMAPSEYRDGLFISNPDPYDIVGYGGIENIQWENSIGEISLLINPSYHGKGFGKQAAIEIIRQAFDSLNLNTVFAECYQNNPAVAFWDKIFQKGYRTILPNRKYSDGVYVNSVYYSLSKI